MEYEYGSFKDFIESTNDEELMDLYVDFLDTGDFSKLEKRLKEKGYQPGEYAKGGRVNYSEGTKDMKMAGYIDPMSEKNDMAMEMFGKQLKDLTESELELLDEEIDRLRSKFMAKGGRVDKPLGPGGAKKKKGKK